MSFTLKAPRDFTSWVSPTDRFFVLAGAGVSAESRIPTFVLWVDPDRGGSRRYSDFRLSHASGVSDFVRRRPTQGIEIGNQLRQDDRE